MNKKDNNTVEFSKLEVEFLQEVLNDMLTELNESEDYTNKLSDKVEEALEIVTPPEDRPKVAEEEEEFEFSSPATVEEAKATYEKLRRELRGTR